VVKDWVKELREYHEFLGWNNDDNPTSQDESKLRLKEDIEFILGTNGERELTQWEREMCKWVGIDLESEE